MQFEPWYNKNYKKLLIIPAALLALSLIYIGIFYMQTGDIINKDVSLTGGTTISIDTQISAAELEVALSETLTDFNIKTISNNAGNQLQLVITIGEGQAEALELALEEFLDYELTSENSSTETTSASLSAEFYKQLVVAVLLAFFWMAAVVFLIFAKGSSLKALVALPFALLIGIATKSFISVALPVYILSIILSIYFCSKSSNPTTVKVWSVFLNVLLGFFMGNFFLTINPIISGVIFLAFSVVLIKIYIKNSVPSFAVMLSAFADIVMTLAVINLIGLKLSTAGIVAFLMLIGYSVDTDILLTTRILKKRGDLNRELFGAFKTGTMMTLTSIIAITTALIVVYPFGSVLNQIFIILLIGLAFDLFNTWITNASIIKWYSETR